MHSRIVQINGHHLNVMRSGQGHPAIMLHGWGASWHHWEPIAPHLTAAGYSVYAPDLYGHGKSAHPDNPQKYAIDNYFASVCSWLHTEGVEKPLLIGHSLGGYLCLRYTLEHPENVGKLVLINPLFSPEQLVISALLKGETMPLLGEAMLKLTPEWLVETSLDFNRHDTASLPEEYRHQVAHDYKRASPHIVRLLSTLTDLTYALPRITSKTLLVWGDKDLTLNPRFFPELAETIPNIKAHRFEGCYHAPHLSQTERFTELLLNFAAEN